jgi:hypothetical protein
VAAYQLLEGGARNQTAVSVQEEGLFLYRKLNWALSGAASTTYTTASGSQIVIPRPDLVSSNQSPLIFEGTGYVITLTRGTGATTTLNTAAYPVTGVNFTVSSTASSTLVTAQFQVNGKPFVFNTYLH